MSPQGPLDEVYFIWLYGFIGSVKNRNPERSHWQLCEQIHRVPFRWKITNDENRAADAVELREEFAQATDISPPEEWMNEKASVLEVLVALAKRLEFLSGDLAIEWFWRLLNNLELARFTDDIYMDVVGRTVVKTLDRFMDRKYDSHGRGGLFPLSEPEEDQRDVEIWYQAAAYLMERDEEL